MGIEIVVRLDLAKIARDLRVVPLQKAGEASGKVDLASVCKRVGEIRIRLGSEYPGEPVFYQGADVTPPSIEGAKRRVDRWKEWVVDQATLRRSQYALY